VILLSATLGAPTPAWADWLIGAYMGTAATSANTLAFRPAAGAPSTLTGITYAGEAFNAPIYYGLRIARMGGDHGFGVEGEFTHAKAIALDTRSADLTQFRQSHGLNLVFGNVAYRSSTWCGGRCDATVRGGVGFSQPHVESTVRNVHQEQYQYGGVAWQVGAGVEYRLSRLTYAFADARFTRVREEHLRGAGAEIAGTFSTRHADVGLGVRLPGK
jgi:hypothetical protein